MPAKSAPKSAARPLTNKGGSEHAPLYQHLRALIYETSTAVLMKAIIALVVLLFGSIVAIYLLAIKDAKPVMFGVTEDLRVIQLTPLSDGDLFTRDRVQNWAVRALAAPWTFDYQNYKQQITDATNRYFTEQGNREFRAMLEREQVIDLVEREKRVVSLIFETPPVVSEESRPGAAIKAWRLSARVVISYRGIRDTKRQVGNLTVVVVRDNSKAHQGRLLAISQYILSPV